MKEILVTIKDSHIVEGNKEAYEITTHGTFSGTDRDYTIEYDEVYDELRGCHTVMNITEGNCVSILRSGAFNTEMIIEGGKRHNCQYATPYGSFMIGIFASEVKSEIQEGVGTLKMKYTIDFYGGVASENEMLLTLA